MSPLTFCPHPPKRDTFNISILVSFGLTADSHVAQVSEGCACRFGFALVLKQMGLSPQDCFSPIAVTYKPGDRRLPKCVARLRFRANMWVYLDNRHIHVGLGISFGEWSGAQSLGLDFLVPRPRQIASCCTSVSSSVKWECLIVRTCLIRVSSA